MSQIISNEDALAIPYLKKYLQNGMEAAAEPVIKEALVKIERTMRDQVGSMLIGYIDTQVSMERLGTDLRIIIRHDKPTI